MSSDMKKNQKTNSKSGLLIVLAAALLLPGLSADAARKAEPPVPEQKAAPQGGAALPEVIIKGGAKTGVRSDKPPLDIEINLEEAVLPTMDVEDEPLKRQPEVLKNPRAGFSDSLANPKTIVPGRVRLAKDPVKVFYPLREILATSPSLSQEIGTGWEMVITDTDGRSFRKFLGRGLPPGSLPWNGRSDRGEIATVGKTYSIVINYKDTHGQARNFVGEPFSFDGIIHQESDGLMISIAVPSLFDPRKGYAEGETVGDTGMDLLKEAADWIKRYYFTYPVKVQCLAVEKGLGNSRAQSVAKILASLMLLPRPEIPVESNPADPNSERLDIVITNR